MNKWMKKHKNITRILGLGIVLIIGYMGYATFLKPKSAAIQYQTATVQKGTLITTVSASGSVSSANNTPIVTQVTGAITKIYVKNGDKVTAGQPIANIELDQTSQQKYQQQLASYQGAQNSLSSARSQKDSLKAAMLTADHNFLISALDKGLSTDNNTYMQLKASKDAADANYARQDAVIAQSQTSLSNAALSLQQFSPTITAPISGVITGLSLQQGSVIPAQAINSNNTISSQDIANITTSGVPVVSVSLTEIDVPKVQIGQKATLTFDAFPDKTFTGTIFSINTTGSVSSGVTTYPVTITLDSANEQIYANMSANSSIITATKDEALYVPTSAVITQNGETVVRELSNGKVTYIPVTTGISSDTDTEIISGVSEGDKVITAVITPTASSGATTSSSPFSSLSRLGGGGGAVRTSGGGARGN
jgi:RND family efflux transporter MFP subunit